MSGWIVIPRWEEFQHRDADRVAVPTWIKTFTRLLSDQAYLDLTAAQRAVLHGIWLEYARTRRELPVSTTSLSRRLNLRVTQKTLDSLNHAGFIDISASKPARNHASTTASTEKRREEEPLTPSDKLRKHGTNPRANGTNPRAIAAAQRSDYEARARGLYQRTGDPDQVADWLVGITSLSTNDRDRILHKVTT